MIKKPYLLAAGFTALVTSQSGAAISFVENFDSAFEESVTQPRVFGFSTSIIGWGESNIDTASGAQRFNDFIGDPATNGPGGVYSPVGGSGATPGLNTSGYLYREIGTLGGDTLITVGGDNYHRQLSATTSQRNSLLVQIFSLPAADPFTFAEFGNDISTEAAATLLGSFSASNTVAIGEVDPFSQAIDTSAAAPDDRIFIRLSNENGLGTGSVTHFDNINIQSSVPEPGSTTLLALGLAAFAFRRRK